MFTKKYYLAALVCSCVFAASACGDSKKDNGNACPEGGCTDQTCNAEDVGQYQYACVEEGGVIYSVTYSCDQESLKWSPNTKVSCNSQGCNEQSGQCNKIAGWEGETCTPGRNRCRDGFVASCNEGKLAATACTAGDICVDLQVWENAKCTPPCTEAQVGESSGVCKEGTFYTYECQEETDASGQKVYLKNLTGSDECVNGCDDNGCSKVHNKEGLACSEMSLENLESICEGNIWLICRNNVIEAKSCSSCVMNSSNNGERNADCRESCTSAQVGTTVGVTCNDNDSEGSRAYTRTCTQSGTDYIWVDSDEICAEGCNADLTGCYEPQTGDTCQKSTFVTKCNGTQIETCKQGQIVRKDCAEDSSIFHGESIDSSFQNTCVESVWGVRCEPGCTTADVSSHQLTCTTENRVDRLHGDECIQDINGNYYWHLHNEKCFSQCNSNHTDCDRDIPEEGQECNPDTFEETCVGDYALKCYHGYTAASKCNHVCGVYNGEAECADSCTAEDVAPLKLTCYEDYESEGRQCIQYGNTYFWHDFYEICKHGCDAQGACIHIAPNEGKSCFSGNDHCKDNLLFLCNSSNHWEATDCAETGMTCMEPESTEFAPDCVSPCTQEQADAHATRKWCNQAGNSISQICTATEAYGNIWRQDDNGESTSCPGECVAATGECKIYSAVGSFCNDDPYAATYYTSHCDGDALLQCRDGKVEMVYCQNSDNAVCAEYESNAACYQACNPVSYQTSTKCFNLLNDSGAQSYEKTFSCVQAGNKYIVKEDRHDCFEVCEGDTCGRPEYAEGGACNSGDFQKRCADDTHIFECTSSQIISTACPSGEVCRYRMEDGRFIDSECRSR